MKTNKQIIEQKILKEIREFDLRDGESYSPGKLLRFGKKIWSWQSQLKDLSKDGEDLKKIKWGDPVKMGLEDNPQKIEKLRINYITEVESELLDKINEIIL